MKTSHLEPASRWSVFLFYNPYLKIRTKHTTCHAMTTMHLVKTEDQIIPNGLNIDYYCQYRQCYTLTTTQQSFCLVWLTADR